VADAGLENTVIGLVGPSVVIAQHFPVSLDLLFIDGGHGADVAWADYHAWTPKVASGGTLLIHDVFPDPADGGRPPFEIYCAALESGRFVDDQAVGSLRVLRAL
jgi:predicted O-methyltransferase YrrM